MYPDWSKNATLYQINTRCFTAEGTFKALIPHLPRIKALGADILWLMPIHPIGEKNRKGILGSPYSVQDYYEINPEFGTKSDFSELVQKVHALEMKIIIDWVPNHTAWDNPLTQSHPHFYLKSPEGEFKPTPWYDWEDIIELDYAQPDLQAYMQEAMCYWVENFDIDGFRCDVAGFVPLSFWTKARKALDAIKPVFLLAEWENRDMHSSFEATYAWSLWVALHNLVKNKGGLGGLWEYLALDVKTFPPESYRMTFTDNHDKNAWEGTQFKNFGDALPLCIAFTQVVRGVPLIYGGQEAGLDKSLAFFEKDEIEWKNHPLAAFFTRLFALKHENQALWNGIHGGAVHRIAHEHINEAIAFYRTKNGYSIVFVGNFSDKPLELSLKSPILNGTFNNFKDSIQHPLNGSWSLQIKPWDYALLTQSPA